MGRNPFAFQWKVRHHEERRWPRAGAQLVWAAERGPYRNGPPRHYGSCIGALAGEEGLSEEPPAGGSGERPYSRAFENFVASDGDEEDVVGLVAYALFKQAIREEAASGTIPSGDSRNPSITTIKTYRAAAEQLLTGVVGRAIDEATPELQRSAILTAVEGATAQIEAHVTKRTGFGSALLTNIIAWVLTLAIAAFVLFLAARPSVEQTVVKAADRLSSAPASARDGNTQ